MADKQVFSNIINGEERPAASGDTLDITNPSTGEVYGTSPNSGPEDTGGFREVLPKTYSDSALSTLTAEVPATGTKTLEFKLKSKAK